MAAAGEARPEDLDRMKREPLVALTGLRFLLAIWVVCYHFRPPLDSVLAGVPVLLAGVKHLLATGYVAVGAFFVLSGFVLAYNYDFRAARPGKYTRFGIARFSRIYPLYLCALLLMLLLNMLHRTAGIVYPGRAGRVGPAPTPNTTAAGLGTWGDAKLELPGVVAFRRGVLLCMFSAVEPVARASAASGFAGGGDGGPVGPGLCGAARGHGKPGSLVGPLAYRPSRDGGPRESISLWPAPRRWSAYCGTLTGYLICSFITAC